MKLVLAEKPSVAQSIAKVLGAAKREDGYLEGNGYVVSWCVGHLVELAQPEVYDAKYSKWAYADLPIFPMDWQYEVSAGTKKQFGILKKLMAREDVASLVCATDAGREGELIFRLVYHKAGCRKPFERLWISSMEDVAIKEGFENLRSGTEYDALYEAALCRERADWIVGINATRLFSTLYGQTLNVGRVMTPTLAMAVMREAAISAFKPELFYTVQIGLDGFTAASERFKTKAAAEAVKQSCSVAIVQKAECKEKTEKPPALYDLTSLQREANRVLGYTAQQTLDYTQNLYEKKLVTYPRTDSRFLTEDMAHSLTDLVKLAFHTFPVEDVDNIPVHAEQVVNNKKVTDHHAIIPTRELQKCNLSELPKGELAILQLISNRLCVAVGDPHRYAETVIELDCGGTVFSTKGKTVVQDGWKALVQKNDSTKSDENVQTLPSVSVGDEMTVSGTEIKEGKTSPPKHFTEDTLLSAMETAGADEMPDEVERKGLGTPATRAGIIEKLVRIGFLERKGDKKTKHLIPTHKGTALVTVMPEQIQSPSMTADWEEKLLLIEKGEYASEDFMDEIKDVIAGLIQNYEVIRDSEVMMSKEANSIGKCPLCGSAVEDKAKAFFCSNRACKFALWKNNRYFASIGKSMTSATAQKLLGSGKVKLKNCKSERTGNTFDATVFMEVSDDGKTKFSMEFENGGKPYEDWNAENYRRYVKRGSTGIALFVMNRDKPYLRYVFDVADTGVRRSSPELKPWEVTPENRSYVMEAMERTFGVAADGVLEAQLEDIASALAAEYWDDYKKQFLDIVANSFLEEYDELNIEVAFKNAVANSVSYTMYCRFVESPDNYFEHEDFQKVFDFNTRQTVNALGTAVNAISTRMFQEIEKAIGEHEQIKATERSTDYERDDLQTGRRLSDSEPSVGERGRETSGQVRQDASSIFGTEQSDAPERHDSDGEPVPAPVGDRGNSESQSGVSDGAVPEGQPRTGQGNAADGVGAAHEQPESTGGGSRDDGAYQQLSLNLFLSENEQISFIDRAESFTPSAFSFAQEEIDHFLLLGSNTDEARKVVALEYMKQKPLEEIVQTLKQVYHGGYGLKEDSGNICAWYAEDGIHLAKGSSAIDSPRAQIVSWETVAERIGELLENGRFATNVELVEASGYERQKLAESLWHLYHDLSEEARSSNYLAILHQEPFRGFPDETADLAEKLDDPRFHATLVQQYSEFRKTLAENPDLLRFHYHKLNLIQKQLYELNMPLREYQTDMMQMPLVRQFITDDEVNADLTRGSGFSGGKARIYNYWQENHSAKEKMDFLKHEYGTGGHSHACSGATHSGQDHDAKGVAYTKSGCDKLQMSWAQVVQRIDGLIRKGRYLSPEEEAERQAIEEAKTDPLEDVYDRFAVIDTEDGEYAIWDNQTDDYYVDPEGVTEYFTDEWLANDYLEEVRQSVAAMESVQPEAPVAEPAEVVEASASEEPKWNYQVGDTVYLDDTAFRVEQITDREVQLRDPTLAYPIFRAENRENFERMLSQDERNHAVRVDAQTEEKPVTEDFLGKTEPRDYTPEYQLLDRLRMDCEYFLGAGQHSEKHLWAGNRHAQIAKMRELYEMIPDKPEWLTPEMINSYEERMAPRYLVAAYHHFENGFDDKLDYYTLEEAEKAAQGYVDGTMEDDGFKYDGAAVYDQQEHKCIRIYGDYPDEKAHAQVRASAEPEQQEPEHFIDHFYVAEDIQKRGALDIKEYSSFDDALRAYYALPDTQRKALGAMNTRDLPGSLDFVQCVDGKDTIIQDYAQVDGWQNAEVMDIIAQLEQSITTREWSCH